MFYRTPFAGGMSRVCPLLAGHAEILRTHAQASHLKDSQRQVLQREAEAADHKPISGSMRQRRSEPCTQLFRPNSTTRRSCAASSTLFAPMPPSMETDGSRASELEWGSAAAAPLLNHLRL